MGTKLKIFFTTLVAGLIALILFEIVESVVDYPAKPLGVTAYYTLFLFLPISIIVFSQSRISKTISYILMIITIIIPLVVMVFFSVGDSSKDFPRLLDFIYSIGEVPVILLMLLG